MRLRVAGLATVMIAIAVASAGCSQPEPLADRAPGIDLKGPWAAEFSSAYASAESDFERKILRDGEVSAAEYEQSKAKLRACLGDAGYTITWDDRGGFEVGSKDGRYPDDFFERSDPILRSCEAQWSGSIPYLFEQVRRNPEKRDEAAIQVACLKKAGLVDQTYSKQRWVRDNESDNLPYDGMSQGALRCAADPLELWYPR